VGTKDTRKRSDWIKKERLPLLRQPLFILPTTH
jgi:hypothetical protein